MTTFHQILVPIDGSSTSDCALGEAIRLGKATGAKLHLLHVVDEISHVHGFEPPGSYTSEILPWVRKAGEKVLAQAVEKAHNQGADADGVLVMEGARRICDHVVEQALRAKADLIVVGSHGRRGIGRVLLGSDAEQIVRHASVPVLVVRATDDGINL